ncbi:MAG: hypothetical protein S4CHLAM102_04780 [Chlamydiia bacterium]|nr:hypothetical protein [Chlamydiia bacterium]
MHDEYDEIVRLFALDPKERAEKSDEIFNLVCQYFARYQDVEKSGDMAGKEKMLERLEHISTLLEKASFDSAEEAGLTPEQVSELAQNPHLLSDQQRESLEDARKKLSEVMPTEEKKKKKKGSSKRKNWMRS